MTSTLSAPRTPTPPFTAAPGTPVHDVTGRLVRALDAARHTGFAGVPELALAIDDFVAARRAQGLPRDAVLTALDALTRLYGCHRGPGLSVPSLAADVARAGRAAYPEPR
jgi:hypothetical protein